MNRRRFFAAIAASATAQGGDTRPKLLLPTDQPDEFKLRIMWYNPVPPIDRSRWRLQVGGLVDKPQSFSLEQLRKLPHETQNCRMKCVQCWSARAVWGGFRFGHLLETVKPLGKARALRIDCADKWYEYMSIADMLSARVLLAMDLEGKPLTDSHGAPLRLLDPTRYGYKSAKLITCLTFVEEGRGSMACDIGPYYSPGGEILAGYDHPLDLGRNVRRKINGGEITEY
ncbi:MAG: molybdopterin-dependent oxidoreductase [Acidobacteria bacterium]|nr:molybdopterin-dependent oxidoreductase [Acidobacteriota bacterium]